MLPVPSAGEGVQTYYWTNQQSARLMFYHDHSWGITRLNVYAGEAAGYLLQDPTELALIAAGKIPADQIPLIIQDKTFVDPNTIQATDPTWAWGTQAAKPRATPHAGDLWWPHVYMPAQNPYDMGGANPFGRWHYGPWFFPPRSTSRTRPSRTRTSTAGSPTTMNPRPTTPTGRARNRGSPR